MFYLLKRYVHKSSARQIRKGVLLKIVDPLLYVGSTFYLFFSWSFHAILYSLFITFVSIKVMQHANISRCWISLRAFLYDCSGIASGDISVLVYFGKNMIFLFHRLMLQLKKTFSFFTIKKNRFNIFYSQKLQ